MKKKTCFNSLFYLISLFLFSFSAMADDNVQTAARHQPFTVLRINLFPDTWAWPKYGNVYGVNLGLGNYNDERYSSYEYVVAGLDFAWFISMSRNVYGLQMSGYNKSMFSAGMQLGYMNETNKSSGMQMALINVAEDSSLFQMGIYNQSDKDNSAVQFGLINVCDNGFLPFFPIINFSTE